MTQLDENGHKETEICAYEKLRAYCLTKCGDEK
jgi:hypothetical protein